MEATQETSKPNEKRMKEVASRFEGLGLTTLGYRLVQFYRDTNDDALWKNLQAALSEMESAATWSIDESLTPGAGLELDRVAGNLEGQENRDQARFVISFARSALGSSLPHKGSISAALGKDNDTYRVQAEGDAESYLSVRVERVS